MEHERGAFKVKDRMAGRRKQNRPGAFPLAAAMQKNACRKFSQLVIIAHRLNSLPVWHTFFLHKNRAIEREISTLCARF